MVAPALVAASAVVSPFHSPFRSGRVVIVRYTRFACQKRYSQHTLYGPPLDTAVATITDQLDRHPGELKVGRGPVGEVALSARMRPNVAEDLFPGTEQVLALVEGISEAEFTLGLSAIQRWNWVMVR